MGEGVWNLKKMNYNLEEGGGGEKIRPEAEIFGIILLEVALNSILLHILGSFFIYS